MLYVALSVARAQVKIGWTSDERTLRQRMRALRTIVLSTYEPGTRDDEAAIDRHLAHEALPDGEWFAISFDVLVFVGEFDASPERAIATAHAYPRARLPRHRANAARTARRTRLTASTR
jgi:hypothetical protein